MLLLELELYINVPREFDLARCSCVKDGIDVLAKGSSTPWFAIGFMRKSPDCARSRCISVFEEYGLSCGLEEYGWLAEGIEESARPSEAAAS